MITKGHDFHDVTLVGIISADTSLNLPDFRAAERTFQLLTQASGRGGRGVYPGRVIIQTVNPDHYAITRAGCHDYLGFYGYELSLRKGLSYPPYSRIVNLHLSSTAKDAGTKGIEKLKTLVKELIGQKTEGSVDVIGPAESPISRIKGRYRWQLLLRGQKTIIMNRLIRNILSKAAGTGLEIKVDVDPVNFM
jgi:primosomal protein N' (replication factor Y)